MEILIINTVIAIVLTVWALARRCSSATRVFCVSLLLAIPLYLSINWLAGYRAVPPPSREQASKQNDYYHAWRDGVLAMHKCTLERYVPKVLPYLLALGILALIPYKEQEKSQP
jgi:hypothetical protein